LEKSTLFVVRNSTIPTKEKQAIIVVDPFSTGALLAADLYQLGYAIIAVYSAKLESLANVQNLIPQGLSLSFEAVVPYDDNVYVMANSISGLEIPVLAVLAGAETGVEVADQLSEILELTTNGTAFSEARRNKYIMGETVRNAGVRAVKQMKATSWGEIDEFLSAWQPNPFQVIVKPMDSAGSDDVTLCHNILEVQKAFGNIMGKVNGLGIVNKGVLVQEYLDGIEYVIDMVSREGEHKVVAIWEYDRRAVNGAGFVCFGERLLTADEPRCREMIDYQKKVVTALGIRYGPTHGEVKWCRGEPVLVEVGARCHGAEGVWKQVADFAYGYNQITATIDAYLNPERFQTVYAPEPLLRHSYGRILFLIIRDSGILVDIDESLVQEIESLHSFISIEFFIKKNEYIKKTIDCFTFGGVVRLVHDSDEQLNLDYQRIHEMETQGLFIIQDSSSSTTAGIL
jgi:biotin carboxylase